MAGTLANREAKSLFLEAETLSDARCARENRNCHTNRNLNRDAVQAVVEDGVVTQHVRHCDIANLGSYNY